MSQNWHYTSTCLDIQFGHFRFSARRLTLASLDFVHSKQQILDTRILSIMENDVAHHNSEEDLLLTIIGKSLQLFKDVLIGVEICHIFIPAVHNCAEVSLQYLFQQTKWRDCIRSNHQFHQVGCHRFWVNVLLFNRQEMLRFYLKGHIFSPDNGCAVLDGFAIGKLKDRSLLVEIFLLKSFSKYWSVFMMLMPWDGIKLNHQ